MNLLKEYCEAQKNEQASGGNEMNLTEFIKLSWGEKAQKVADAVDSEYGREYYNYVVDMYEDRAIMRFYSYFDGSSRLMAISYSISEDGIVSLGDIKEVHVTYEDVPEVKPTNATEEPGVGQEPSSMSTDPVEPQEPTEPNNITEPSDPVNASTDPEPVAEEVTNTAEIIVSSTVKGATEPTNASVDPVADPNVAAQSSETADTAAQDTNAQDTQMKVGAVDEQTTQEEGSSSAALTDSERAEFEALKRKEKEELIESYKEFLSEEQYNGFFATIDSVSKEELELSLLKEYKVFTETNQRAKQRRAFAFAPVNDNAQARSSLAQDIQYYLGK